MKVLLKMFCLISILFLVGCGRDKYKTCNMNITNKSQEYTQNSNYKVYYRGKYVTKIVKYDNYMTDNEVTLDYLVQSKKLELADFSDVYGGLEYNVALDENNIKIQAIIDMSKVDIDKLKVNDYLDYDYVSSDRLTLTGAKYFYEAKGFTCDI